MLLYSFIHTYEYTTKRFGVCTYFSQRERDEQKTATTTREWMAFSKKVTTKRKSKKMLRKKAKTPKTFYWPCNFIVGAIEHACTKGISKYYGSKSICIADASFLYFFFLKNIFVLIKYSNNLNFSSSKSRR